MLAPRTTCHYGTIEIPLSDVLLGAAWLYHKDRYTPIEWNTVAATGIQRADTVWMYADHKHGLYGEATRHGARFSDLLAHLRSFEAYDPRDRIFGILGLYRKFAAGMRNTKPLSPRLFPDYNKGLEEILLHAARHCIDEQGDLSILGGRSNHPAESASELANLPSWIPRSHIPHNREYQPAGLLKMNFKAAGRRKLSFISIHPSDDRVLSVMGRVVSSVRRVTLVVTKDMLKTSDQSLKAITMFRDSLFDSIAERERETALAMTLTCTQTAIKFEPQDALNGLQAFTKYMSENGRRPPVIHTLSPHEWSLQPAVELASNFEREYIAACRNRRLFATSDGRLGAGSEFMVVGDVVAVLYGCPWPVVLRARPVAEHYEMLGVAYVHGIMYGEAVTSAGKRGKMDDAFHIH